MKSTKISGGLSGGPIQERLRALVELIPSCHAAYRPLVADGLLFFLGSLSPPHLAEIVDEQIRLPQDVSLAHRLVALFRCCPTLHKLGQVVSHDRRLAPELRRRLQMLETQKPTTPMAGILDIVRRETGRVAGLEVSPRALAEASVAVVVPFVWRDGDAGRAQRGVFKILRPGIAEKLDVELQILPALGAYLEERCAHYRVPLFDFRGVLESVARLLINEIRFDLEQAHLARAGRFYADMPSVLIPRLLPFSTPHLTAMERVDGDRVTVASPATAAERRRLAETLIDALLARPFWSAGDACFHADPHAGNLFRADDGRLAIFDWALVVHLDKAQREAVMQIVLGALVLDEARVCRAVDAFGRVRDAAALRQAVAAGLREVRRGVLPGFDWMTALLDPLASSGAVQFSEEVLLLRKALLTLTGVVADVSDAPGIDAVLIRNGGLQLFRGLVARALSPFDSRECGAHLSNADILAAWIGMPATALRFWTGW